MNFNVLLVEENTQLFHFNRKITPVLYFMHELGGTTLNTSKASNALIFYAAKPYFSVSREQLMDPTHGS
jgi:hypothetical protein